MITISASLVLVDAVIVVDLHSMGLWEKVLSSRYRLAVPSIVVDNEAQFYDPDPISRVRIDLASETRSGRIEKLAAGVAALATVSNTFADWFLTNLDPGELEALAIIVERADDPPAFCTSDGAAISAAAMLGFSDLCVCLEEFLSSVGLGRQVHYKHSRQFLDQHLKTGRENRITRNGLAT